MFNAKVKSNTLRVEYFFYLFFDAHEYMLLR